MTSKGYKMVLSPWRPVTGITTLNRPINYLVGTERMITWESWITRYEPCLSQLQKNCFNFNFKTFDPSIYLTLNKHNQNVIFVI